MMILSIIHIFLNKIRKIIKLINLHVSSVIHTKKWNEKLDLGICSVFGTSKATQESETYNDN
jgi:hypothetical protein